MPILQYTAAICVVVILLNDHKNASQLLGYETLYHADDGGMQSDAATTDDVP